MTKGGKESQNKHAFEVRKVVKMARCVIMFAVFAVVELLQDVIIAL